MITPGWLIQSPDEFEQFNLGVLKSGKEAAVFLVERVASDGRSCLLAYKRYPPRRITHKGELQRLGFQRNARFVKDHVYREGRTVANRRDARAAQKKSRYGRELLGRDWATHEYETLVTLAGAGVAVPWPVERVRDGLLMQYIGERHGAAPRLADARLDVGQLAVAAAQLTSNLRRMAQAGLVHGDLSAYNLLWWEGAVWIIDLPQALDRTNPSAVDFLQRDLENVGRWFHARGVDFDIPRVFDDLTRAQ